MKKHITLRTGRLLVELSGVAFRFLFVLLVMFKNVLSASAVITRNDNNTEEGDLTGLYNFHTRKFDNGTDPYGWYEEDL